MVACRRLAERLVIGYATSRSLRENKVVPACRDGVNVVIWSFVHLEVVDGVPRVRATFDVDEVKRAKRDIDDGVQHLVAFGGWNGPHPDTSVDGATWWETWETWNDGVFDGVDWDLEGHDDAAAPTTTLTAEVEDIVVDFTRLARENGYVVGAAPAESYLDANSNGASFSRRLDHSPPWRDGDAPFPYAGRNAYARLVSRCDFDFVSVQFYEGYSRAWHETTKTKGGGGVSLASYLENVATRLMEGFDVGDVGRVAVPSERLVLGFANGWADGAKFLKPDPEAIRTALARLQAAGREPRGVMFWVIDEEGANGLTFAKELSRSFK
ncbi:hypothetical protein CTAYLR_009926 [Chrysophaeum taylorii]|uniref:Chitinase n=1 Tax=Chrysophaeum taylorii TaxID=2483200 RepID=A0AAD7UIN2_9STRA|nr:hypothetical protein CTAYLR_009926 [Chrysophaeum taylorii]